MTYDSRKIYTSLILMLDLILIIYSVHNHMLFEWSDIMSEQYDIWLDICGKWSMSDVQP